MHIRQSIFLLMIISVSLSALDLTEDTNGKGKTDRWLTVELYQDWNKLDINKNGKPDESCLYSHNNKIFFIKSEKLDSIGNGVPNIWIKNIINGTHYITETEADSNFDGKIDLFMQEKDGSLFIKKFSFKNDGIYDSEEYYENGNKVKESIDTNRDGKVDDIYYYENNRLIKREIDSVFSGKTDIRIDFEYKEDGSLKQCIMKLSSKHDGVIDEWQYTDEKRRVIKIVKDPNRDGKLQTTNIQPQQQRQTNEAVPPGF